ncbi:uncharacterized protein LOC134231395 [Saccostrea cucullata]|uniref:uncharacterized protein LOC134231395 n=1 Tax=Saccostrea cuccullata TaxID=36930 RepID=UPI002ED6B484
MASGFRESQDYWEDQAFYEAMKNHESRYHHGRGPCNIFILDTSASLGLEGFQQMKETFCAIIDGYSNFPDIDENVAVIICGRSTKFQRYYSNHYSDIKHCLDDVEFGGLTPLIAALTLAKVCLLSEAGHTNRIGDFYVHPRIILISDGRPTDFSVISDIEDSPAYETKKDKQRMLDFSRSIGLVHPIFCIPVGSNPDLVTLEFLCAQSRGGKIVYPHEARQFAKYSENLKISSMLSYTMKNDGFDCEMIMTLLTCKLPGRQFTEDDKKDIFEICSKKSLYVSMEEIEAEHEAEMDYIYQEEDPNMPPLGSRVKRGPDWVWDNQDNNGPGTVIGHDKDKFVHVEWDTGSVCPYIYTSKTTVRNSRYDVIVCSEPRITKKGKIATDCLVKRGQDWEVGDKDDGDRSIGSVYRCKRNGIVHVRWQNGQKTESRFGYRGKYDLQIC